MASADEETLFAPERRTQLTHQIEEAFADVPYPGDDRLVDNPWYFEAAELAERLCGKHWRDIPARVLDLENPSPLFFTREALQFYFPAYLLHVLRDRPDRASYFVFIHLTSSDLLDPAKDPQDLARAYHWDVLTPAQRAVTCEVLRFYRDYLDTYPEEELERSVRGWQREIDLAIERYWGRSPGQ